MNFTKNIEINLQMITNHEIEIRYQKHLEILIPTTKTEMIHQNLKYSSSFQMVYPNISGTLNCFIGVNMEMTLNMKYVFTDFHIHFLKISLLKYFMILHK